MARGTIYHLSTDPESMGSMDESDFYNFLDRLDIDFVQNENPENSESSLAWLRDKLASSGFEIVEQNLPEGCAFAFQTGSANTLMLAKMAWFSDRYRALNRYLGTLSLEDFATSTSKAFQISELAEDPRGDAVWLDEGCGACTKNLLDTVRDLAPDTVFYVAKNTVLMH